MLSQPVPSQLGQVPPFLRCQKAAANHGAEKNPSAPVWQAVFSTSHGVAVYIATREGWLYLAVVIDLFSRQVVGWAMGKRMTRHLVIDALTMAWFRRRPAEGLIFHSDQGSQYASADFQATLRRYGIRGSMSRRGNCWDNAVTETLFGSLKVERLHDMRFETRRQAKDEVVDWLTFYSRNRMHSTLGYTSPMAFEENWRRQQETLAA